MKNIFKLISMLLTVVMLLGAISAMFTVTAFAEEETTTEEVTETPEEEATIEDVDYVNQYFATPDEKIKTMGKPVYEKDGIKLYADQNSGEVVFVNEKTGEKLFTNPYDVGTSTGNEETKAEILSQIIVTFTDGEGQERIFTSFLEAAERDQIVVERIKNGIRVEYTIGREQSKILVPRLISMERFEEMILAPLLETFGDELYNPRSKNPQVFDVQKMLSYFMVYAVDKLEDLGVSKGQKNNMENTYGGIYDDLYSSDAQYARALKNYPIVDTMPVFVFDPDASEAELTHAEEMITKYCPEYTYEELEYDHILTEYKSDSANPPVFRMALEYKVEEDGLSVRLPANGIRFNESLYTLETIDVLPYMGAGNYAYEGYNFFPDGSGTLFDFQDLNTKQTRAVSGKVYGTDFAYHEISGTYQKTIRYPVFGIVEDATFYTFTQYHPTTGEVMSEKTIAGNIVEAIRDTDAGKEIKSCNGQIEKLKTEYTATINGAQTIETKTTQKRGFVCIIEEGDALASLTTYHSGALSDYNTVKMQFTPRPKDSYNLSDSISVGSNSEWTVVSDRKYVGNYLMKYITLSDAENVEGAKYDASWFGMAVAYRDYLTNNGIISKLTADELTSDIPLYIETFGAIETTEKILSIPVDVMTPLTTFENVVEMYENLASQGMKNINFKLTGYANGGMYYTVPGRLKFEKAVGGNAGFQELLDKAKEVNDGDSNSNFGVYPDFDFAYTMHSEMFDGHSALKHNAQTIDGRYASKKVYKATQQKYENYFEMIISPAYFADFYEKLTKNYLNKYENVYGISVSTLGHALNSDFDEDEPYNREDAKAFTTEAFAYFKENYKNVMTDGGNAYVWKYADHILGVALDSSRYNFASEAVPFIGVVLHGSISFAGDPLNMEGDLQYALLKAIENGASPYFILSYQNTQHLKDDELLSKYYSIRYDIWSEDIASVYNVLNDTLADVQDKYIVGHEFLSGGARIPDSDELMADILAEYEARLEAERNAAELLYKEIALAANIARQNGRVAEEYAAEAVLTALDLYTSELGYINKAAIFDSSFYSNVKSAYGEYIKVAEYSKYNKSQDPAEKELYAQYQRINTIYNIVTSFNVPMEEATANYDAVYAKYATYLAGADFADAKKAYYQMFTNYSSGKISKVQLTSNAVLAVQVANEIVDAALEKYASGEIDLAALYAVIDAYGIAKVDTTKLDTAIVAYANGTLAVESLDATRAEFQRKKTDEALIAALKEAIADFKAGTLADKALDAAVETWYASFELIDKEALDAELENYKTGKIKKNKLDGFIKSYCVGKINKDEIIAKLNVLKDTAKALEVAENNYRLEALADKETEYAAAKAEFEKAVATFDAAIEGYMAKPNTKTFNNAVDAYNAAKAKFDEVEARYNLDKTDAESIYENALKAYDAAEIAASRYIADAMTGDIDAETEKYINNAEAFVRFTAAEKALAAAVDSGFALGFDESYETYFNYEFSSRYTGWGKIATAAGSDKETYDAYYSFYKADQAFEKLEDTVEKTAVSYGSFDNYTVALAQHDTVVELGYAESTDEAKIKDYEKAVALVKQTRNNAITAVAATDSNTLADIRELFEIAVEHLDLAIAAIETLALSEGVTVKYEEGKEASLTTISNYDEIAEQSFIVKQAIDRARAVYYHIEADSFEVVEDGVLTDYTYELNGETYQLSRMRTKAGKTLYYYGTYENGYQYLTLNSNGTFSVYKSGDMSGTNAAGENVYHDKDIGKYYSVNENGQTYYVTGPGSGTNFILAEPIVYEGELFATLEDGTEIYKDGDTYYSENGDGTYTRYTYSKCIRSCVEEIEAAVLKLRSDIEGMSKVGSDSKIADDIQIRIDRNHQMNNKGEEEEEIEDTDSKYSTENIVAVTYGNDDGSAYKTIVLNYNNYSVSIVYEGIEYTIPAYQFVVIKR